MQPSEIKQVRLLLKLTQADFARKIGVSTRTLASYEKGDTFPDSPTIDKIIRARDILDKGIVFDAKMIKKMREIRGWTQEDLAIKLGVARETVSNYERGEMVPATKQEILKRIFANIGSPGDTDWKLKESIPPFERIRMLGTFSKMEIILYLEANESEFLKIPEYLKLISRQAANSKIVAELAKEVADLKKKLDEHLKI